MRRIILLITVVILLCGSILYAENFTETPISGKLIHKGLRIQSSQWIYYGVYQDGIVGDDIILHFVYRNIDDDLNYREVTSIRFPVRFTKRYCLTEDKWWFDSKDSDETYHEVITNHSSEVVLVVEKKPVYEGDSLLKVMVYNLRGEKEREFTNVTGENVLLAPESEYFIVTSDPIWGKPYIQRMGICDGSVKKYEIPPGLNILVEFKDDYVIIKDRVKELFKIDNSGDLIK
jgi:hypothetical protein